jgi:hypothetical protein
VSLQVDRCCRQRCREEACDGNREHASRERRLQAGPDGSKDLAHGARYPIERRSGKRRAAR